LEKTVVVDFPLQGEWITPNTPGKKIPSHGTDMLGQRYAFDFVSVQPGSRGMRFYKASLLRYLILGVRLQDCYGWGKPIFSPVEGTVVQAEDGWPERNPVHLARDLAIVLKHAFTFDLEKTKDLRSLAGNNLIIEFTEGFAFFAHAQTGSIKVSPGDRVAPGQHLANVGHSGNSTAPHLHFHLMDQLDPRRAQGIPCCFRDYEVFSKGSWTRSKMESPRTQTGFANCDA
jgi:hypothetical protein